MTRQACQAHDEQVDCSGVGAIALSLRLNSLSLHRRKEIVLDPV